jgi:hypothetical protein
MSWNRPEFRKQVSKVHAAWRGAMRDAVAQALTRYRLNTAPFDVDQWVTLIMTINEGIILERLSGIEHGHTELLQSIELWLSAMERAADRDHRSGEAESGSR